MKKLIFILIFGSVFSAEEQYAELLALDTKLKKINANLRIVMDKHDIPSEEVAMYFSGGYYSFAIYLNKKQRQEMVELYNKYEKWKRVAYENNVSHNKVLGKINKIKAYFNTSEWHQANKVTMTMFAGVGSANTLSLIFPEFTSVSNQYMDAKPPVMMFIETSKIDSSNNDEIENLGVTSPREFILDNLADTNLVVIKRKLVEDKKKTKNVDSLFD